MKPAILHLAFVLAAAFALPPATHAAPPGFNGDTTKAAEPLDGLWGVNYYAPFALDYFELARRGFDHKAAIRDDVAHFRRLGLDLLRIHCFDRQISRHDGDPAVVAFECVNEPLYPDRWPQANVTDYIGTLVDALRKGGATQPIFYNSFNGYNEAAGASMADGVSCCAYPLGLLAGRPLVGPQLAKIRESTLKPDTHIAGKRRMAYEFDAADTLDSCLYPAIAKMLRGDAFHHGDGDCACRAGFEELALPHPADGRVARHPHPGGFRGVLRHMALGASTQAWNKTGRAPPRVHEA